MLLISEQKKLSSSCMDTNILKKKEIYLNLISLTWEKKCILNYCKNAYMDDQT